MKTLVVRDYQCASVQQYLAAHTDIDKASINVKNKDRLAHLTLQAEGKLTYYGMDIDIAHRDLSEREVTTVTLTSTEHDLDWMLKFVEMCFRWERSVLRSSMKGTLDILLWRWWPGAENWKVSCCLAKPSMTKLHLENKNDLIDDLKKFLSYESTVEYNQLGIRSKRVYLIHGQHGTGKSAVMHALAAEVDMNLAIIDCTHQSEAADLEISMRKLPERTILAIENMDMLFAKEAKDESKASLSLMLRTLDGYTEMNRLVIIVTACNRSKFDTGIINRIDYLFETTFKNSHISAMLEDYMPYLSENDHKNIIGQVVDKKCSPGTLQKYLLRHRAWDNTKFARHCSVYAETQTSLYN